MKKMHQRFGCVQQLYTVIHSQNPLLVRLIPLFLSLTSPLSLIPIR